MGRRTGIRKALHRYQQHCTEHSSCSSHYTTFALSHPQNLKLSKELCSFSHNDEGNDCKQLHDTMNAVISFICPKLLKMQLRFTL